VSRRVGCPATRGGPTRGLRQRCRAKVAALIDFDNIVISRYDELHGPQAWRDDRAGSRNPTRLVEQRLSDARVDFEAVMDFAPSFGTVAISRAYANWAAPISASYDTEMLKSSIDLMMFPLTGMKNGADIRLAIDVIDDLARHQHITQVLVVAGDSDYVALAQRVRRLGRNVIGVGAARSVGTYWEAACDEFLLWASRFATGASLGANRRFRVTIGARRSASAPSHNRRLDLCGWG